MNKYLRRYTDLPAVFYLLRQRKLTLLDPASWNDKNDSYFLELYRERKGTQVGISSVLYASNRNIPSLENICGRL